MLKTLHRPRLTDIVVTGLFRDLLQKQSDGLTGHMEELFDDLSASSAWLGGIGERWERGPYYLDGLIPLAYLMSDEKLITKAKKWIDAIVTSQRSNGFFGPFGNEDWWPRFVAIKALASYATLEIDARIVPMMERFFRYLDQELETFPLDFWAHARGMEAYEGLEICSQFSDHRFFDNLLDKLHSQTFDWQSYYKVFPYSKPTGQYLNKTVFSLIKPIFAWLDSLAKSGDKPVVRKTSNQIRRFNQGHFAKTYLSTHGVNIAMSLKYLCYHPTSDDAHLVADQVIAAYDTLMKHHGSAIGIFSGDEHLNGPSPSQGIELCTIVELMYSLEESLRFTKDGRLADRLEFIAFNALPAAFSHDMCSHQYFEQTNQVEVSLANRDFYDAGKAANLFGIAPNFGCCAANMHQGWPKFVHGAVLEDDTSVWIMQYVSGQYSMRSSYGTILIQIKTDYPFTDQVELMVIESDLTAPIQLHFRIPYSCDTTISDGFTIEDVRLSPFIHRNGLFPVGYSIHLHFHLAIRIEQFTNGSYSICRGGLLFAHRLRETEVALGGIAPFHDRGFASVDDPRIVPILNNGYPIVVSINKSIESGRFYDNVFELQLEATLLRRWPMRRHSLANVGRAKSDGSKTTLTLVPYGQTILRVAQFPSIDE